MRGVGCRLGCNCFVPGPIAVFGILWVLWKLNPLLWFTGSAFWALALLVASGVSLGVFRVVRRESVER